MLQNHVAIDEIERADGVREPIVCKGKRYVRKTELERVCFRLGQHGRRNVEGNDILKLFGQRNGQSSNPTPVIQHTSSENVAEVIFEAAYDPCDCTIAGREELITVLLYLLQHEFFMRKNTEIRLVSAEFFPRLIGA